MAGIILAKNAGAAYGDDDGICASQSISAAAHTLTINGSLTSGGAWANPGWGFKIKAVSAGNDTGKNLILTGKFYASDSVGAYSTEATIALGSVTSASTALYATELTKIVASTLTAGSITVGINAADGGSGIPVGVNHGSMYSVNYGGTFGGAKVQIKKYFDVTNEWLPFSGETGETTGTIKNYQINTGATLKAFLTSGSTTTALAISADTINPMK